MAQPATAPARVSWADFLAQLDWRQGEHVTLVGPTGTGKTTLALALLPRRRYTVAFGTKPRDDTLQQLVSAGWHRIEQWPPYPDDRRVVLWPKFRTLGDVAKQRAAFAEALGAIFTAGSWCVFADETRYLVDPLRLTNSLRLLWLQGRSLGISLVCATQRPAWVPREAYDQATHLFFWRDNDRENLRRLRDIGGIGPGSDSLAATVANLAGHDVLYLNTRTGQQLVTRAELGG